MGTEGIFAGRAVGGSERHESLGERLQRDQRMAYIEAITTLVKEYGGAVSVDDGDLGGARFPSSSREPAGSVGCEGLL